jgi:hypothetical protein
MKKAKMPRNTGARILIETRRSQTVMRDRRKRREKERQKRFDCD